MRLEIDSNFSLISALGNQHASAGRYDMAVQYFTAAIKYNPKEFK